MSFLFLKNLKQSNFLKKKGQTFNVVKDLKILKLVSSSLNKSYISSNTQKYMVIVTFQYKHELT